jgi:hypothetical protein
VLIRYDPFSSGQAATDPYDAEAELPADDPPPVLSPEGVPGGPAVSDEVLHLLQRGGRTDFTATVHEWYDLDGMLAQVPEGVRRTGFGGLGLLVSAVRERAVRTHLVSALRIGGPGQYQIDRAPAAARPEDRLLRRAAPLAGLRRQGDRRRCRAAAARYCFARRSVLAEVHAPFRRSVRVKTPSAARSAYGSQSRARRRAT